MSKPELEITFSVTVSVYKVGDSKYGWVGPTGGSDYFFPSIEEAAEDAREAFGV